MTPKDRIKQILFEDKNKIVHILEQMGCHKINPNFSKNEIRSSLPDGTNATSVSILLKPYIPCYVFSRGSYNNYKKKDIITFVQFILKCSFVESLKWLCLNLQVPYEDYEPTEILPIVYELRKERYKKKKQDKIIPHVILPKSELKKYKPCVVPEWIKEGLSPESQKKYNILDDQRNKRWLIPIFDEDGNLLSFKGRTYAPNWEVMGIPKYLYYHKLGINDILFGLDKNIKSIEEKDEIILFESEKSVIAADSYGYDWCSNLGTNGINSNLKRKIIALRCSNCVLAFDKDVSWQDVMKEAKKISNYMNVFIIYDNQGLLNGKQSPVDCGKNVFDVLYKNRIRVK